MTARGGPPDSSEAGPLHRNRPTATNAAATTLQVHVQSRHAVGRRADWARELIARAGDGDLPLYGSAEWEAAPETVRVASCVRAAECWRPESDPHRIAARLEQELEAAQRYAERDYDAWREIAGRAVRIGLGPSHAKLVERRAEIARPSAGGAG